MKLTRKRVARPRRRGNVSNATREKRFAAHVTLSEAAAAARMSVTKASYLERGLGARGTGPPDPRDVAALDAAVVRLAAGGAR